MVEKRKYRRASLIGLAQVTRESDDRPVEAYTINISFGGIALYCKEPLEGRQMVQLHYVDASGAKVSEKIAGRVVWQRQVGTWYAIGVQFERLDRIEHSMTFSFLEEVSRLER